MTAPQKKGKKVEQRNAAGRFDRRGWRTSAESDTYISTIHDSGSPEHSASSLNDSVLT